MRYLFVGAHQDDIEYSCGGTVLRLAEHGHEVFYIIVTNGGASLGCGTHDREREQNDAFRFSGAKDLFVLEHADGDIPVNAQTIKELAEIISSIDPDVVFTHYPKDSHQDHRNVSDMVRSATRRKYSLVFFDSYSSIGFMANLFVDTTKYVDRKKKMLGLFKTQISKYKDRGIDFIGKSILISTLNGYECGVPYAEGFWLENHTVKGEMK